MAAAHAPAAVPGATSWDPVADRPAWGGVVGPA
jgi:hypothetical protein